jgi:hypothetical protein
VRTLGSKLFGATSFSLSCLLGFAGLDIADVLKCNHSYVADEFKQN